MSASRFKIVGVKALEGLETALRYACDMDVKRRSYRQIAKDSEISTSVLSTWFSGRRLPSLDGLGRLLDTLGLTLEDLGRLVRERQPDEAAALPAVVGQPELAEQIGRAVARALAEMGVGASPTPNLSRTIAAAAQRGTDRAVGEEIASRRRKS